MTAQPQNLPATLEDTVRLLARQQETLERLGQRLDEVERRTPEDRVSIVVFSDDMDRILAGFTVANGALAMDMQVSMYFTFWGLAAIKKATRMEGADFRQRLLGVLTPGRSEDMGLSKLNFLGLGPRLMRSMMRDRNVSSLEELRDIAQEMDTRFIGCTMAMELMGIQQSDLVDGVELGGVATFMEEALKSRMTLFL